MKRIMVQPVYTVFVRDELQGSILADFLSYNEVKQFLNDIIVNRVYNTFDVNQHIEVYSYDKQEYLPPFYFMRPNYA